MDVKRKKAAAHFVPFAAFGVLSPTDLLSREFRTMTGLIYLLNGFTKGHEQES